MRPIARDHPCCSPAVHPHPAYTDAAPTARSPPRPPVTQSPGSKPSSRTAKAEHPPNKLRLPITRRTVAGP
eukprot:5052197-Pleurochrysis_carterae.AAC.1